MTTRNTPTLIALAGSALLAAAASAQPTMLISQGSTLYRYQAGTVSTYQVSDGISGMTNVPNGMTVGTMNGGATSGDVIAVGGLNVYRVDNPLGTPSLTQIGLAGGPNASPVFVGGKLYGVAGVLPQGSIVVEWDPTTFTEINRWDTGVFGGPGGMVAVPGTTDEFYYAEFNYDEIFHYKLGDTFSTPVCSTPNNDYVGLEMIGGRIYASYALPLTGEFVLGEQKLDGTFNQIALLDTYKTGITGLTAIIPAPGTLALITLGGLLPGRRR